MKLPLTIEENKKGLLNKEYTVVDLVDEYLARIKRFDKNLNSFITVTEEKAYKQAKISQDRINVLGKKAFEEQPLLGSVVAYKDIYLTKGTRTTAGSKVLETYIPSYSATVVKKLKKAGAITIGKTNLDAWAHGASGENSDFGPTKNPWNYEYVPGGSSSGSAVSVSSRFSLFAMGSDTGGSIRLPASFTNTVGLKPTYGAVSRYGVVAMASSLDCMGSFARSVVDAQTIFELTKGLDRKDSTVVDTQTKSSKNEKLKIGIPKEYFAEGLDKEIEEKVLDAVKVYKKAGIEFVEVSLPNTKHAINVYYIVQPAEVSSNLARFDGVRYGNDRITFGEEAKRRIMLGTYVLSAGYYDAYYLKAMKVRSKVIKDFDKAFEEVDALIAPVSPTPPFKVGEKSDDPLQMYLADVLTVSANLAGIPAISIPAGFTNEGLPVGFQLMGPRFYEGTLFKLGKLYQEKTDWHLKTPNLGQSD